jgi:signal transduction histidine kinase
MSQPANAERSPEQAAVLIIADDAEFTRSITTRWQAERSVPAFTLMSGDLCPGINANAFELAIVGSVRPGVLPSVLTILESTGRTVVFLAPTSQVAATVRESHTRTLVLRQHEGWLDALILVSTQALRCSEARLRADRAERAAAASGAQATLGRYMMEMRHTLNNALTSILGNSELLLAEPGTFSAQSREQVETVRNMAFRMNEILQRFSSIEMELRYVDRQAGSGRSYSASVGT